MSSKRRSGPAGSPEDFAATPDPKRRKRNDDTHFPEIETRETTTDLGLKLIRQLKKSQDKNGRNVAIHFTDLPSRTEYPDYYRATAMPLSLNMIEQRLENFEYENMERLESDLKRMVQNAKDYNHSKSPIFEDAERIRKALSNFMPKHNPAYLRPGYRAYPTPIPQELLDQRRETSASSEVAAQPERVKLIFSKTAARRRQGEASRSAPDEVEKDNMKEDQLAFLKELSGQEDAINFEEKVPKKDYPDYYKLIKKPTSISDVRALVEKESVQDWDALAREVRLIWDNAKEYNQEGSDIYMMAQRLESWSEERMRSLGAQPRRNLKLSLSQPKPKALRLTMGSSTPTPTVIGGTIDSESLRRQKEDMGQALSRAQRANSKGAQVNGSTPVPSSAAPSVRRSASLAGDKPDVVMADVNGISTPKPQEAAPVSQPPGTVQLPTPVREIEPSEPAAPLANGTRHHEPPTPQPSVHNAYNQSLIPYERRYRDPGKGVESALIGAVTWMTNPAFAPDPKWKLIRFASPIKTQQSFFTSLPPTWNHIRVIPNLTAELRSRRRYKIFFVHNDVHIYRQPNSTTVPGAYEVTLTPGQNILTVEVIADLHAGERKEYAPPQLQFDFERVQMVIHSDLQS
ncbi:uncharacterized protein Z518_09191 [Rhinocladiella mackenziei CBS 650.93]|uniref:Bromo domain-containing protein n=1 Tax=Rhinocladiella mackenziei CBS 650.93 TaxID=1442369 RepID=A0A0D2IY24_9EURO|nr:uncharacterized protein Z518_09191 [Rhinocladiella mackenziei CBS 650.93]KIX01465.1 hypothetical protein Z518_09191 [Rhinocladiella mackenziei CBS 650.93]